MMSAKLFDHLEKTPPKITSSGVFISDPRVEEKGNIEVLLKGQSFPLKFVGIYPNRVLQLDLQEVEGLPVRLVRHGSPAQQCLVITFARTARRRLSLRSLRDW